MAGWREQILKEFQPGVARLFLVADRDGLIREEGVLQELRRRGFDLLYYEDPVAFRFLYESRYRKQVEEGSGAGLVVVVPEGNLDCIPYDLWQRGRRLHFSLADLFPCLDYGVLSELDRSHFDSLYEAYQKYCSQDLGSIATRDFILRHVFGIAPETIKGAIDLLLFLLRRHYEGKRVPRSFDERLIQILRRDSRFGDWPLEEIVPDDEAFFAFLQERWPVFLDRYCEEKKDLVAAEEAGGYSLRYAGPQYIPFDHPSLWPYVDNLFAEGYLIPVAHSRADRLRGTQFAVGIKKEEEEDRQLLFDRLAGLVEAFLPGEDARYHEWLNFARRWAELVEVRFREKAGGVPPKMEEKFRELCRRVDTIFMNWLQRYYPTLHNLPAVPPVMVHHIPRFLARNRKGKDKVALLVLDGMAYDQWLVIKEVFSRLWPRFRFKEEAVFAWVPTLTPVSRQALFAGKPPLFFSTHLTGSEKEPRWWKRFWADEGCREDEVAFFNLRGNGEDLKEVAALLTDSRVVVLGAVIRIIDEIMHGVKLGTTGMHSQVRLWAQGGYLERLFTLLSDAGFVIYVTSDHGNVEAVGKGLLTEGALADRRGHRVRIYPNEVLRQRVIEKFPDAVEWEPVGLPGDYLPLMAGGRSAFVAEGERTVCHGGITVEEVIVPLIRVIGEEGGVHEKAE